MVHSARTYVRWIVDQSWKQYVFNGQDQITSGLWVRNYDEETVPAISSQEIDLMGDTTHVQVDTTAVKLEYPQTMNTGYDDLNKTVNGSAKISMQLNDHGSDLTPLVGKHVIASISMFAEASTGFNASKATHMNIDLGQVLIGAVWLVTPKTTSSYYMRRVTCVASGILASAVRGLWTVKIAWQMNHATAIGSATDNFILHVDLQLFGYDGIRSLLLIER